MNNLYTAAAIMFSTWTDIPSQSALKWSSPVPFFGALSSATVATVGLNPSNREYLDPAGLELRGALRRLPTLDSLGLSRWDEMDALHMREVLVACETYFDARPYDTWFKVLDFVLQGAGFTFYGPGANACHLDLVPFATKSKWGTLSLDEREKLLRTGGGTLGHFLRESSIELLILNGRSVVDCFARVSDQTLREQNVADWTLPRQNGGGVVGIAYEGAVTRVGDVDLGREVAVLGYNHNLQSSYGVTSTVLGGIRDWVAIHKPPAA